MAPLEMIITGSSDIHHHAERGVLAITVSCSGLSQEEVSRSVTQTSNQLQRKFTALAPKTATGTAAADAAITVFSMTGLRTRSWMSEDKERNKVPPCQYEATSDFEAIFRDFDALGEVAAELFVTPHVSIRSTTWRLTDETNAKLGAESRKAALRDAMQKAGDYAEVLGRSVVPVQITDGGEGINRGRTMQTARKSTTRDPQAQLGRLELEPEDIVLYVTVDVKFSTE